MIPPARTRPFPARFHATWSPAGNYVALNLYYGRRLSGVVVAGVNLKEPRLINPAPYEPKSSLEETVLQDGDKYVDGEALTSGEKWLNATDLNIEIEMQGHVKDKNGQKQKLDAIWSRVVSFNGATVKTISNSCDSYDKTPGD